MLFLEHNRVNVVPTFPCCIFRTFKHPQKFAETESNNEITCKVPVVEREENYDKLGDSPLTAKAKWKNLSYILLYIYCLKTNRGIHVAQVIFVAWV